MEKQILFSKKEIINSAVSPFNQYCVGYPGQGSYVNALVMGIGSFEKTFSHQGSKNLDSIIAYDRAEIDDTYMGQINMIMVSSFCGPQGLIWGYDIAKENGTELPALLSSEKIKEFGEIKIRNGRNLRRAAKTLFGSKEKRHFPLLPGTHVPCAGKFYHKLGPSLLYGAIAIGIPKNRNEIACLLMEDVGEIMVSSDESIENFKEKILLNMARSILEIGKNQGVIFKEIFIDMISRKIPDNKTGCVLVAMPYILLAKNALTKNLTEQSLPEWTKNIQQYFLGN